MLEEDHATKKKTSRNLVADGRNAMEVEVNDVLVSSLT